MHRVDSFGNNGGLYTSGTPGLVPATNADPNALNALQEELCNIVERTGATLITSDDNTAPGDTAWTQVATALDATYGQLGANNTWGGTQTIGNGVYGYSPPLVELANVPGLSKEWSYGGNTPGGGQTNESHGTDGSDAWIGNSDGGGYYATTIRVPKGATITGLLALLSNSDASTAASVTISLVRYAFRASGAGGGGFTQGYDTVVISDGVALSVPANQSTAVWTTVGLDSTSETVPADGYLRVGVYWTNGALLGGAGASRLYGVRLQYSLPKVASTAG